MSVTGTLNSARFIDLGIFEEKYKNERYVLYLCDVHGR